MADFPEKCEKLFAKILEKLVLIPEYQEGSWHSETEVFQFFKNNNEM